MLIIEAMEVCKFSNECPYNNPQGTCYGAIKDRAHFFECEFVINGQIIRDAGVRNPLDQTGKMKIIME